jgi:hypothetical protein
MSLRFRHSLRIAPGVRLNLGLHGAGLNRAGYMWGVNRRGMFSVTGSSHLPVSSGSMVPRFGLHKVRCKSARIPAGKLARASATDER